MTADLTLTWHDASDPSAPPAWASFADHPAWSWAVVHALAVERRGRVVAATLHSGPEVVGVACARRHRLGLSALDFECPGTLSLPGIWLRDPDDLALWAAAVATIELAVRRDFGRFTPIIAYRQVSPPRLSAVKRRASLVHATSTVAILDNDFADYPAYLRALTRSRRGDQVRLVRRHDEDPALTIHFGPAPPTVTPARLRRLSDLATARHARRWPPARHTSPEVFAALLSSPNVQTLSYCDGDSLLACLMVLDHPVLPVLGTWGASADRSGLWFDAMARSTRWAIEAARPRVIGGMGLPELKAALNYAPHPHYAVATPLPLT